MRQWETFDEPFRPEPGRDAVEVGRLVREGLLRRLAVDVVVAADVPDTLRLRAHALALLLPGATGEPLHDPAEGRPDAVPAATVGFEAALWLWTGALPEPAAVGASPPDGPHRPPAVLAVVPVIVLRGHRRPRSDALLPRQRPLAAHECRLVHGVAVTDPARTAADLLRDLPEPAAAAALGRLRAATGVTDEQVLAVLRPLRRGRGVAQARRLLAGNASATGQSPVASATRRSPAQVSVRRPVIR
jgi:hypothetical protein